MIRIEYWTRWNNEIRRLMHVAPPICDILGVYYNKGRIPPKYKKRQNFVNFHCRPAQFMSEAAARTILTLRTLDIAHFEAETRSSSGVSSKLGQP